MDILILTAEVVILIGLSALCSGLNISLMSLEVADLRRKARLGNAEAAKVLPLRKNGHLSLAAILLTNVATVSATSLVLESATGGLIAGLISTLLIVIFGEITPQAIFVRHALRLCARFSPALRAMIVLTYPLSKPIQLLLDKLFTEQGHALHTRQELGLMITEHLGNNNSELDEDEVEIIRGALQLSEKRVHSIMTPIEKVYWVSPSETIDGHCIDDIKARGWSRIPVFNKRLTTCYGVLHIKDLVDIDFNDGNGIEVQDLTLYPTEVAGSMTALDTMFRRFITGGAHLIPIERDDHIVGIVTIEDLLEEIVGHEIEDETDRRRPKSLRR